MGAQYEDEDVSLPYHRKYRSASLSQYKGNARVVESAMNVLNSGVRPQVWLLYGEAGCGKTSFARLLGKEYRCTQRIAGYGACGICESCRLFEEYIETGNDGLFMDLREFDIAHKGGKEDIDSIIEQASMPTLGDEWRVFIFDECHMASKTAQNSLLKLTEEPPEKLLMIFCTTDPEKMLDTLLSRCQYELRIQKPTKREVVNLLEEVAKKEGVKFDAKGLSLICTKSRGVPRKSLMNLEKVVNNCGDACYDHVVYTLNLIADTYFFEFFERLMDSDNIYDFISFIGRIKLEIGLKQFIEDIIEFLKRGIYLHNGVLVDNLDKKESEIYGRIFSHFSRDRIASLFSTLLDMNRSGVDIESCLLLLAYNGVRGLVSGAPNSDEVLLKNVGVLEKEGAALTHAMQDNIKRETTATPEDIDKLVETQTADSDLIDIVGLFNAQLVTGNDEG